jgi:hypothetical protein
MPFASTKITLTLACAREAQINNENLLIRSGYTSRLTGQKRLQSLFRQSQNLQTSAEKLEHLLQNLVKYNFLGVNSGQSLHRYDITLAPFASLAETAFLG